MLHKFCFGLLSNYVGFIFVSLFSIKVNLLTSLLIYNTTFSTCGEVLGPLLSKLVVVSGTDVDSRTKMEKMSRQVQEYELLVKQLKVRHAFDSWLNKQN